MLRFIVRQTDNGVAIHVGGPVHTKYHTFDMDIPRVEEFLRSDIGDVMELVGCEILTPMAQDHIVEQKRVAETETEEAKTDE